MSFNHGLQSGQVLTNDQLASLFMCAPQGGIRRSHRTNSLVILSDHTKSLYDDRWIEDVFHYTGMGQTGDQSLEFMQNKTIFESNENGVKMYLFEVFEPKNYIYVGKVALVAEPYEDFQIDNAGNLRRVWIFPLGVTDHVNLLVLPEQLIEKHYVRKEKNAQVMSNDELLKRAASTKKRSGTRTVSTTSFDRDPYISEYAKRVARGICQLCDEPAPFTDKNGRPYLETHHIDWLSKGGEDSIQNTIALCPNCHKKMHVIDSPSDVSKLKEKAAQATSAIIEVW